ncbi:MAG TPA: hypothetical protein VIM51_15610 [Desulfosporosinus sp.]
MSSNPEIFDLLDKAADRLGWVVWSLNEEKKDSTICERALQLLCNVVTNRMEGDTVMTNIGSYVLPVEQIVPTLKEALVYLEQAIEGIKENEGENPDYDQCMSAIPDIREFIEIWETGPISIEQELVAMTNDQKNSV